MPSAYLYPVILFYTQDIDENQIRLHGQEAQHCSQVLRKRVGDKVMATDGIGNRFEGQIVSIAKDSVTIQLTLKQFVPFPDRSVHLAIAPTKNPSRMEWLIEKVTEIGITTIQPIICQRSERRHIKMKRLQKILNSAAKQSLKYHFPILYEPLKFDDYMSQLNRPGYIAHYDSGNKNLWAQNESHQTCVILIGPEGDFTEQEVGIAKKHALQPVNLGSYRLRTETAGIVAVTHLLHL